MKLQVISDLHLEFGLIEKNYEKIIKCPSDVVVLAGDFSSANNVVRDIDTFQKDAKKPVIFVPGNHEYYGTRRKNLDPQLKSICNKNIHVLIEDTLVMDGVVFLGSTGWWDGSGGVVDNYVKAALNDFEFIYDLKENLDGIKWGRKSKIFFDSTLWDLRHKNNQNKVVCVSHHMPHGRSVARCFAGSKLNVCFRNHWEGIITEYQPDVWIHGHTHFSFDYNEGNTRIVCNPQGYPIKDAPTELQLIQEAEKRGISLDEASKTIFMSTENFNFIPDFVIEI